jgi:hypothetical protein
MNKFEAPELIIINFESDDIITSSKDIDLFDDEDPP